MQVRQFRITDNASAGEVAQTLASLSTDILFCFGAPGYFADASHIATLSEYAKTTIGCSTAGEICCRGVSDNTLAVTSVTFSTAVDYHVYHTALQDMDDSYACGERLGNRISTQGLTGVLLFGKGVGVNGSAVLNGLKSCIGNAIPIVGGLAADGDQFHNTFVMTPDGVSSDEVVVLALYGEKLSLSAGSFGGWQSFGPARRVSRASGNVLYELDNQPALQIYKKYLGEYADQIPASALLFPFEIVDESFKPLGLIRTILGVDENEGSLTLAGDVPLGGYLRLMHASRDNLVSGAEQAAREAMLYHNNQSPASGQLALLISCVGRKMVMGESVDEEIEAVSAVLKQYSALTGFYSYGEIGPVRQGEPSHLLNQTMTVALLSENEYA